MEQRLIEQDNYIEGGKQFEEVCWLLSGGCTAIDVFVHDLAISIAFAWLALARYRKFCVLKHGWLQVQVTLKQAMLCRNCWLGSSRLQPRFSNCRPVKMKPMPCVQTCKAAWRLWLLRKQAWKLPERQLVFPEASCILCVLVATLSCLSDKSRVDAQSPDHLCPCPINYFGKRSSHTRLALIHLQLVDVLLTSC